MINVDERAPLTALKFLIAINFEKVADKRGLYPLSSGSLRVSHCFPAPLSPSQVSAPCTPQLRTPAQLPPAHPRAKIRSALILSCKRSLAPLLSPFHRSRSARYFFEVKPLTARHKRIESYYN